MIIQICCLVFNVKKEVFYFLTFNFFILFGRENGGPLLQVTFVKVYKYAWESYLTE